MPELGIPVEVLKEHGASQLLNDVEGLHHYDEGFNLDDNILPNTADNNPLIDIPASAADLNSPLQMPPPPQRTSIPELEDISEEVPIPSSEGLASVTDFEFLLGLWCQQV